MYKRHENSIYEDSIYETYMRHENPVYEKAGD